MPNQFLSDEFGDIEDYFVTDYWLIDNFVGDTLWVFGLNGDAQLGTNDTTQRNTPVTTFAGGTNWKQVFCGGVSAAAIKTDGTLWTWGKNNASQLGINNTTNRSTPVTTFSGGNDWKQVSVGYNHMAAIKTDGSLWTWGLNGYGPLGINNTQNRSTPVTTFAGGTNWKQVFCLSQSTLAIKTDGTLWGWGRGSNLELGTNDTTQRNTPVTTFAGGTNWKQVFGTSAIKTDGTLWLWGYNGFGSLGINAAGNRSTPVTTFAGGTNWKQVSGVGYHTAAIKTDGTLWLWGAPNDGRLGNNEFSTNRLTPVTTFAGGTNWKQVAHGTQHTAAIKTDGSLWVWGSNSNGQLGTNGGAVAVPVTTLLGGNNWKSVDAIGNNTAAIKSGLNVDLS